MEVKTKLRKVRVERGIPEWWLAGIAKTSKATLTAIERHERPAMTELRARLAKILGVSAKALFDDKGYALEVE